MLHKVTYKIVFCFLFYFHSLSKYIEFSHRCWNQCRTYILFTHDNYVFSSNPIYHWSQLFTNCHQGLCSWKPKNLILLKVPRITEHTYKITNHNHRQWHDHAFILEREWMICSPQVHPTHTSSGCSLSESYIHFLPYWSCGDQIKYSPR